MVKFGLFKKRNKDDAAQVTTQQRKAETASIPAKLDSPIPNENTVTHPDPPTASMIAAEAQAVISSPPNSPTSNASSTRVSTPKHRTPSKKNKESRQYEETNEEPQTERLEHRESFQPADDEHRAFGTGLSSCSDEEEDLEEEEMSLATSDDGTRASYDEEETMDTDELRMGHSYDASLAACEAVGDQKKFFHKDVVLHNIDDNNMGNDLVIRAMYFVPRPKAADHVVVRIEASTVSARDCMFCRGVGLERHMLPFVPGFEIIGTIQTLGEQARAQGSFKEGQRVAGISLNGGGNSRFISIPLDRLVKISETVKSTSAVCLIHDYMAALKALRLAKKAGSPFTDLNILLTDGFSPVGQAVINLAGMEGANIFCCADESKHAYLTSLGAKCFDKAPESWLPSTSGTFDVVIDNSCIDAYSSSWFALNRNGTLICLSPVYSFDRSYEGGCGIIDFSELHKKWAGMKAKYIMPQTHFFDTIRDFDNDKAQYIQDLKYLTFLLEKGEIKPKIAEKVSLEDVPDAQRLMYSGKSNGTIVCVPWIEN